MAAWCQGRGRCRRHLSQGVEQGRLAAGGVKRAGWQRLVLVRLRRRCLVLLHLQLRLRCLCPKEQQVSRA